MMVPQHKINITAVTIIRLLSLGKRLKYFTYITVELDGMIQTLTIN